MTISFDIKNLLKITLVCLVLYIAYLTRTILLVGVFGFLVAYMLNPLVVKMEKLRIRRPIAAILIVLIAAAIVSGVAIYLLPGIYQDVLYFLGMVPSYAETIMGYVNGVAAKFNIDLGSLEIYKESTSWIGRAADTVRNWLGSFQEALSLTVSIIFNVATVPLIAFFLLIDFPNMELSVDKYLGASNDRGMRKYFYMFSEVMSSYFRGQFIVVMILCILYSTALKIAGLEVGIILGTASGLLSIVPYLGFAVGIVMSVVMAVIQFQDIAHPIYVIIGYAVVQAIESFVVTPRIMGSSLGLHPVATIIVLMVGGTVGGLMGMILALPIAALCFQIYREKYMYVTNPELAKGEVLPPEHEEAKKEVHEKQ